MALSTLATTVGASISSTVTKQDELSTLTDVLSQTYNATFAKGTGANQADSVFHDQRTLADGANETLDFTDSSLTDKLGEVINLSKLKALAIKNGSSEADLIIGGAASNQLPIFADGTDKLNLPPGGRFIFISPDANGVDVSTNAKIKFEHDGTGSDPLVYDISVVGVQT